MTEQEHAADGGPPITPSPERITEPASPQAAPPSLVGFLVNCFPANAPTGPQMGVSVGIGNPATGQQYLNSVFWVPEEQAEQLGQTILDTIRKQLEEIRRARMGAPSGGLALPGSPGFGMPASGPNGNGPR